jgi:hypothetical protein
MNDPILEAAKKVIPDSRATNDVGALRTPFGMARRVFCANCGKFSGYCFADTTHLMYLCECCDKHGSGLDIPVVDPQEIEAFNLEVKRCSITT